MQLYTLFTAISDTTLSILYAVMYQLRNQFNARYTSLTIELREYTFFYQLHINYFILIALNYF